MTKTVLTTNIIIKTTNQNIVKHLWPLDWLLSILLDTAYKMFVMVGHCTILLDMENKLFLQPRNSQQGSSLIILQKDIFVRQIKQGWVANVFPMV